jgi:hypothetical protein
VSAARLINGLGATVDPAHPEARLSNRTIRHPHCVLPHRRALAKLLEWARDE